MRKSFILLLAFFLCVTGYAQKLTISGVVIDKDLNEPLTGVNVLVKGTTTGTITDFDGKYTLEADANSILVFSYLSMKTIEEPVNGRTKIDVTMVSDAEALDEVVVTAMGIKRESKTLTYSAQTVGGKDLNEIKNVNMINSLQGKSAGLQITPNSTGAGGSSKILFRGNKSISGSNQPLIVVDGVPMMMSVSDSQVKMAYGGERDGGDAMSTINPDDIAQITLLKGASAAALYGAVAANGAIMITTKSAQAGKVAINVSSNTTVESAMSLPKFQNNYGMSDEGTFSWGSKLGATSPNYARKFYQPGYTTNNSISLSGGTENISSYFSYANVSSNGIMPENDYLSHNLMAKVGFNLWKKVHVDVSARYNKQHIENQPSAGYLNNPITGAYLFPRGEDWDYYKSNYEVYDGVRNVNVHNWTNTKQEQFSNPYWMLNRQTPITDRNRYEFGGSVKYDIMEGLSVTGRLRYERGDEKWILNEYASSTAGRNLLGTMKDTRTFSEQTYADALASYNKTWDETYSLSVTAGGSFTKTSASSIELIGWGDKEFKVNNGVITPGAYYPNIFSPKNYYTMQTTETLKEKRLNSVFATAQFGYKEGLFLDVSARNDWSSTLPKDNDSYFYPSVGVSWIFTQMLNKMGHNTGILSFGKIRASWAQVGNDTDAYMLRDYYKIDYDIKGGIFSANNEDWMANPNLKNETINSWELGLELKAFDNRVGVDVAYYKKNAKDQIIKIDVPSATGFKKKMINAGNIENKGVEIAVNATPVITDSGFQWDTQLNWSKNNNKVVSLTDDTKEQILSDGSVTFLKIVAHEGGAYGDIYGYAYQRDDKGNVIIGEDGVPLRTSDMELLGNNQPKWMMGWSNTLSYKNFVLNFMFDMRYGGDVYMGSIRAGASSGNLEMTLDGRDGMVVPGVLVDGTPNTKSITSQAYWNGLSSNNVTEAYMYDATNIRLRELSLGYNFPRTMLAKTPFTAARLSFVARNLFMIYSKTKGFDPEAAYTSGNAQGIEYGSMPTMRSLGFNINLAF